jgi:N6-L-threonylcarbamoyladenine synthase
MNILAIETSCDETAMTLMSVEGEIQNLHIEVHKELVASQVDVHKEFGGVVPMLAKREHLKNLPMLYQKIFGMTNNKCLMSNEEKKSITHNPPVSATADPGKSPNIDKVDLIAVTVGPGLEPALWAGINFAQELSQQHNIPMVGVNHLHGHMYSFLLEQKGGSTKSETRNPDKDLEIRNSSLEFPCVVLLVSGGHTMLILMKSMTEYEKLGETRDDAVGECFDKVARMLGFSYPGGPEISQHSLEGGVDAIEFPSPMIYEDNYDFSYSGLKTSVLYYLRNWVAKEKGVLPESELLNSDMLAQSLPDALKNDVAASFQEAAIRPLIHKTVKAIREYGARSVVLGGGVAANNQLRESLATAVAQEGAQVSMPPLTYCMDNATMIGIAGYVTHLQGWQLPLEADGNLDV